MIIDHTNRRFGRLVVLRRAATVAGPAMWECLCDCGQAKIILAASLQRGATRSCGCLHREASKENATTHGMCDLPEWDVWSGIKARCLNPKATAYKDYGGRGIKICDRWENDFSAFLSDMGRRPSNKHTIDRRDNNRGYEPSNCQWATRIQQSNNRRAVRLFEWSGRMMSVAEICRETETAVTICQVHKRLRQGWSLDDALFSPALEKTNLKRKQAATNARRQKSGLLIQ